MIYSVLIVIDIVLIALDSVLIVINSVIIVVHSVQISGVKSPNSGKQFPSIRQCP